MKLALLQPTLGINLYDLAVILQADLIVLQDCEIWSRKGRVHRALIRTPDGTQYIRLPVRTEDRDQPINRVRIDTNRDWLTPMIRSLRYNYRNSRYFDFYEPEILSDLESGQSYTKLLPFVTHIRSRLFRYLEFESDAGIQLASGMENYCSDPDQLARDLGAETVYQEHDSRHYQRQSTMRREPQFEHPVYKQQFDGFEPWCSLFDLLFMYGPESFKIIDSLRSS